jgi:hypothetical protein
MWLACRACESPGECQIINNASRPTFQPSLPPRRISPFPRVASDPRCLSTMEYGSYPPVKKILPVRLHPWHRIPTCSLGDLIERSATLAECRSCYSTLRWDGLVPIGTGIPQLAGAKDC